MKGKDKDPVGSSLTRKIQEYVKAKKIDFIVDLIIAGFIFYIVYSIVTGLWVLLNIRY
ncbi:hypothetical protein [Streptococcus oralis]